MWFNLITERNLSMATNPKLKPGFSARSADPNMMTSTDFSFVRKHWYVGIKTVALYIIFAVITSSVDVPYVLYCLLSGVIMLLWVYFDYQDIFRLAMRDQNLVKYNYIAYDEKRGLKTGLMAQLPGLFCVFMMCILSLGSAVWSDLFRVLWLIFYSPFMVIIGAIQTAMPNASIWMKAPFYLIPMVVQPVIGYLAYKNGYHDVGIFHKLIYRSREKDKRLR